MVSALNITDVVACPDCLRDVAIAIVLSTCSLAFSNPLSVSNSFSVSKYTLSRKVSIPTFWYGFLA